MTGRILYFGKFTGCIAHLAHPNYRPGPTPEPTDGAAVPSRPLHCKEPIPKIWNKYSQKRNYAVTVPIFTFMCLWAINILPPSICLFCCRKYVDWSWEYTSINRSQIHECGNWVWGRAIPRKGIYKWDFRCSVYSPYIKEGVTAHLWKVLVLF